MTFGTSLAMGDNEGCLVARRHQLCVNRVDTCQRRSFIVQGTLEVIKSFLYTLDLNNHPTTIVEHKSDQTMPQRLSVDERPKAHTLDDALNDKTPPLNCRAYYRCHSIMPPIPMCERDEPV